MSSSGVFWVIISESNNERSYCNICKHPRTRRRFVWNYFHTAGVCSGDCLQAPTKKMLALASSCAMGVSRRGPQTRASSYEMSASRRGLQTPRRQCSQAACPARRRSCKGCSFSGQTLRKTPLSRGSAGDAVAKWRGRSQEELAP